MKSFVYVISGEHGRHKIGMSNNPARRLKELQTASAFPLKFEFIGESEDRFAGSIEVRAKWILRDHKAIDGGDEWFVVPPEVAITAVMASAHHYGYKLAPRDPADLGITKFRKRTQYPLWANILMLPFAGLFLYWIFGVADARMTSGDMLLGTFAIEAVFLLVMMWLLRLLIKHAGLQIIDVWQDLFARPASREPFFKDPTSGPGQS